MSAPLSALKAETITEKVVPSELQNDADSLVANLLCIYDTAAAKMEAISVLCARQGLDEMIKVLPEKKAEYVRGSLAEIEKAWYLLSENDFPKLSAVAVAIEPVKVDE